MDPARAADRSGWCKVGRLAGYGAALLAVGWALVPVIPAIKQIYTASFTLQAMGWSMLAYALFYALCDVAGWRRGTGFFVLFGQNALFAYMFGGAFRCCRRPWRTRSSPACRISSATASSRFSSNSARSPC